MISPQHSAMSCEHISDRGESKLQIYSTDNVKIPNCLHCMQFRGSGDARQRDVL